MYNSTCVVDVSAGLQPACCGLKPAAGLTAARYTVQIRMRNARYRSFSAAIDLYQPR
jgi:hypothetical protein